MRNNGKRELTMTLFDKNNINDFSAPMPMQGVSHNGKIKEVALEIAKRSNSFRIASRKALYLQRKVVYDRIAAAHKVEPNVILFCSFDGRSYSDSPRAIYEYMLAHSEYDKYTFIWAFRDPYRYKDILDNPRTYIIQSGTASYEEQLAKSKYWVFNYRVADHIYPKNDQVYVQLWHGTPLKKLGYDISISDNAMNSKKEIRSKYDTDANKFNFLLAPSEFAKEKFISAWNLIEKGKENCVIVEGYPRNDYLINHKSEDRDKIKRELGIPVDKKVILYAPTWRDNQHNSKLGYVYTTEVDFDLLKQELADDYIIVFRAHYLVANSFDFEKYNGFIFDASRINDINSLYVASDMLITDYSSVFFDYANLDRPMLFYMYDYEKYASQIRGFYMDVNELPGPIVKTSAELINCIKNSDKILKDNKEKYAKFKAKYTYLDDGMSSKRVAEIITGEK